MGFIEQRLSSEALNSLDEKSRQRLQTIERICASDNGLEVTRHLIGMFNQNVRVKPAVAAVAIDELVIQFFAARTCSAVAKEIGYFLPRLRNWIPRKSICAELKICVICALVELRIWTQAQGKKFLGELLAEDCRANYPAYTLARMSVLFDDRRRKELLYSTASTMSQASSLTQLQVLYRLYSSLDYSFASRSNSDESWIRLRHNISRNSLAQLPTAALVLLLQVYRDDSGSMGEIEAVSTILRRRDRHQYIYPAALAKSAFSISRNSELQELVSSELALFPPLASESPLVLSEFAKFGVMPMHYLARSVKPLLDAESSLKPIERLQILTALATLGTMDPLVAKRTFEEYLPQFKIGLPHLLYLLPDALWAFSICDLLFHSKYTEELLKASHDLIKNFYRNLDERERMRIGRAAMSVGYELPGNFRNSLRGILYKIEKSPPRANQSEEAFVVLLQKALPEARVEAGGFAGTHHLDATVCLHGVCFNVELDGRYHEVYDLFGRKIGHRGADILRDKLVEDAGYRVVRFLHKELRSSHVRSVIRQKFGLQD